jgi:hypothetical protein
VRSFIAGTGRKEKAVGYEAGEVTSMREA